MKIFKIFGQIFEIKKPRLYSCSVIGCMETTDGEFKKDIRQRWMLGITLQDGEEKETVNICPKDIQSIFGLSDADYRAIELGESLASNEISTGEWKNAISSLRT